MMIMAMEKVRINENYGIMIIVMVHGRIRIIVPQQLVEKQTVTIKQDFGSFDQFL